jgi:hypothetical protein
MGAARYLPERSVRRQRFDFMKKILTLSPCLLVATVAAASLLPATLSTPAMAQDAASATASTPASPSELAVLRAQITALQQRLDQLEAQQKSGAQTTPPAGTSSGTPAPGPNNAGIAGRGTGSGGAINVPGGGAGSSVGPSIVTSNSKLPLTVGGLAQVQALGYLNQEGPVARASDTFRLRRAEVRIAGSLTPRVSGLVVFDAAKALNANFVPASSGTGGTVSINRAGNVLQDLQISYLMRNRGTGSRTSSTSIDVGQFKIPVGYESTLISTAAVPFVERSVIYTARDPFGGGYGDVRDTGIQLRGTQGTLDYRIGLFNGLGERQNDLALSDNKAILGLLSWRPQFLSGLQIGVSGGIDNTRTNSAQTARPERSLFNTFAIYKRDKFTFQGEYLSGRAHPLGTITERDIRGYYAGVSYLFTPKVEGLLRYDVLNTNLKAGTNVDATVRDMILGMNYYIKGQNAKIQLNLVHRNGASGGNSGAFTPPNDLRDSRNEIRTQAQVAF